MTTLLIAMGALIAGMIVWTVLAPSPQSTAQTAEDGMAADARAQMMEAIALSVF